MVLERKWATQLSCLLLATHTKVGSVHWLSARAKPLLGIQRSVQASLVCHTGDFMENI
jgi:hypothetical protein